MKNRRQVIRIGLILVLGLLFFAGNSVKAVEHKESRKILFYRSPMNPQVTSPVPQKDEMGMDFVPVYEEAAGLPSGAVRISPEKQQLIGVKTEIAKRTKLIKKIRTVGKIAYDPELYNAQNEFVQAQASGVEGLITAARTRLRILGMSEKQIEKLSKTLKPDENLLLGGKKIWLYASIFEYDIPYIKIGQRVTITSLSLPGKSFLGTLSSVNPILDPETRTTKIRAEISNLKGGLIPEMFVNVEVDVDLGARLVVSRDAILDSGTRQVIFVDKGNGYFEPREVKPGIRSDSNVEILSGISEGEKVVTSGNFLIDSESRLKSAFSGMKEKKQ